MSYRTTILLDDDVRTAARELANAYGCSVSEAIRRAVLRHRDTVAGISPGQQKLRLRTLAQLFDLFEDNDAAGEIRRLKEQDEGF